MYDAMVAKMVMGSVYKANSEMPAPREVVEDYFQSRTGIKGTYSPQQKDYFEKIMQQVQIQPRGVNYTNPELNLRDSSKPKENPFDFTKLLYYPSLN